MRLGRSAPGLSWIKSYKRKWLKGDLSAGLTVGVMLVPQGMAYALIAGLPPIYGLYASTIPILVYALFGTSRQMGVGPVALVSLLVASGVSAAEPQSTAEYITYAVVLSLLSGCIQFIAGLLRMGFLASFLSHPITSGFTSAAAIMIGVSQLRHLLGIEIEGGRFLHQILPQVVSSFTEIHWPTLTIGVAGIALLVGLRKKCPRIPGALILVAVGIVFARLFHAEEAGVRVIGEIPSGLPAFTVPHVSFDLVSKLMPTALAISFLSFIESWAVAKVIVAKKKNYKIDPDAELRALGLSKIVSSFFLAYPTTGSFSRSAVNDQSGAHTGLSGVVSASMVVIILLFFTPYFYDLPKALLASIVMVAVSGLIDIQTPQTLFRTDRRDLLMLAVTFLTTLFAGLALGVLTGAILSLISIIYRASRPHIAVLGRLPESGVFRNLSRFEAAKRVPGCVILRIDSALFYGNMEFICEELDRSLGLSEGVNKLILDVSGVSDIDSTAIIAIQNINSDLRGRGIRLCFVGMIGPVRDQFMRHGLFEKFGGNCFFTSINDAAAEDCDKIETALQTNY